MHRFAKLIPFGGFVASTLAVGTTYWSLPSEHINLPDGLYGPGLLILICGAALSRMYEAATFWKSVGIIAVSLPVVVMLRVSVETAAAPGSHALWPFELIVSGMLGFACALTGGLIALTLITFREPIGARST